jgi:hypothetical protein
MTAARRVSIVANHAMHPRVDRWGRLRRIAPDVALSAGA